MGRLEPGVKTALERAKQAAQTIAQERLRDEITTSIYNEAQAIATLTVRRPDRVRPAWQERLDDVLTGRLLGIPVMLLLLAAIFWFTMEGADAPSEMLASWLFALEPALTAMLGSLGVHPWLTGLVAEGMYRTMAWVIAVMLPPMAIFFPMFTLLEDLGYLPRVAFNLDRLFGWCGAHGKQSLTMSMGFACNCVGVTACRIIESPRERLIAILTNNFVPCNGRFPLIIALSAIFLGAAGSGLSPKLASALSVMAMVMLGVTATLFVSFVLSRTLLKGLPSAFVLELPPYRLPQVGRVLVRSVLDRTIFVLGRAAAMAAPAGAITWMMANTHIHGTSVLYQATQVLDPVGRVLGLDGVIILAFILGLPANEIVMPVMVMAYMSDGTLGEIPSLGHLHALLVENGWSVVTAVSTMMFSVLHFPCSTTLWTIYRETRSARWAMMAFLIPTAVACTVLLVLRLGLRIWASL